MAKCRHCPKLILCKGGTTVGLKRHLEKVHNMILQKKCEDESPNKKHCIQSNLDSMIKKISLSERLACFADGFSLRERKKNLIKFVNCFEKKTFSQKLKKMS